MKLWRQNGDARNKTGKFSMLRVLCGLAKGLINGVLVLSGLTHLVRQIIRLPARFDTHWTGDLSNLLSDFQSHWFITQNGVGKVRTTTKTKKEGAVHTALSVNDRRRTVGVYSKTQLTALLEGSSAQALKRSDAIGSFAWVQDPFSTRGAFTSASSSRRIDSLVVPWCRNSFSRTFVHF